MSVRASAAALVVVAGAVLSGRTAPDAVPRSAAAATAAVAPAIDVRLQPEHSRYTGRVAEGARIALEEGSRWFGSANRSALTIVDTPWRANASVPAPDTAAPSTLLPIWLHWLEPRLGSGPEQAAIDAVVQERWRQVTGPDAADDVFVAALARYTSAQLVEVAFRRHTQSTAGASFLTARFFDGFVPFVIRSIRLDRDTDLMDGDSEEVTRLTRALVTLERYLGRPAFESIVREFTAGLPSRRADRETFFRVASAVSGQDLGWFADQLATGAAFDYGVQQVTREPAGGGRTRFTVVIRRAGHAIFPGTSNRPLGPFEAGRGVVVDVTFADGTVVREHWDGRSRWSAFSYESAAAIERVVVDPEQVLLLDQNRTNNSWSAAPQAARAATKWSARWMLWLQDALLTWSVFV